jgi:hypothetical protein
MLQETTNIRNFFTIVSYIFNTNYCWIKLEPNEEWSNVMSRTFSYENEIFDPRFFVIKTSVLG